MRRFVLEALQSLRSDLEMLGSTLLFSTGPIRDLHQLCCHNLTFVRIDAPCSSTCIAVQGNLQLSLRATSAS